MRVWSNFADFLYSPGMARFNELLGLGEGANMKALDMADADCTYQRYIDRCQRLELHQAMESRPGEVDQDF